MTAEKRHHPRMSGSNKAAVVKVSTDAPPVMCTVADISKGGAGLTFVNIHGIPDAFSLHVKGEDDIRACRVVWRKEPHRMGVAFESGDDE